MYAVYLQAYLRYSAMLPTDDKKEVRQVSMPSPSKAPNKEGHQVS